MTTIRNCFQCEFYAQWDDDERQGFCQRFPPKNHKGPGGVPGFYPTVSDVDWCGEFRQIEPSRRVPEPTDPNARFRCDKCGTWYSGGYYGGEGTLCGDTSYARGRINAVPCSGRKRLVKG